MGDSGMHALVGCDHVRLGLAAWNGMAAADWEWGLSGKGMDEMDFML